MSGLGKNKMSGSPVREPGIVGPVLTRSKQEFGAQFARKVLD